MSNLEKLSTIITDQLNINDVVITEDTTLEDLGADSLALVELVMSVEDKYQIEIPDEELQKIVTIGDFVNFMDGKV